MRKLASCCLLLLVFAGNGLASITKVAPTQAAPGEPFTIIDSEFGRLSDGSVAIFVAVSGGAVFEVPLRTHKPHKTAQGRLPLSIFGGDYMVSVRTPQGAVFTIGNFHVIGLPPLEPTITPSVGGIGTNFTITDPQGRMQPGDLALFYAEGQNPQNGAAADSVIVSSDGLTLTASVPRCAPEGVQNFVSVRPTRTDISRFGDLGFFVTVTLDPNRPSVQPLCAIPGIQFTITDPQGRMVNADRILFTLPFGDPANGARAISVIFSSDGKSATGFVPEIPSAEYLITVHEGDPNFFPPLFEGMLFVVSG